MESAIRRRMIDDPGYIGIGVSGETLGCTTKGPEMATRGYGERQLFPLAFIVSRPVLVLVVELWRTGETRPTARRVPIVCYRGGSDS
jgi:hypothetical protein